MHKSYFHELKTASIHAFELGPMENFIYLIHDHATKRAAIVDPGWEPEQILLSAQDLGIIITDVFLTHSHFDHVDSLNAILEATGARTHLHENEARFWGDYPESTILHCDGAVIQFGETPVEVLHTPGHTPGSVCYLCHGHLFTGDTLFVLGCGRCDLPGGNIEEMRQTLRRLKTLPGTTVIHPGHDYGQKPTSTIAEQIIYNPVMSFSH